MFVSKKLSLSFCAVSLALSSSFAQSIEITSSSDASLLSDTLIIPNSGVTVTSAVLSGGMNDVDFSAQAGTYTNRTGTYGLPSAGGVVFSTGDVSHYEDGPNNFPGGEGEGGGGVCGADCHTGIVQEVRWRQGIWWSTQQLQA